MIGVPLRSCARLGASPARCGLRRAVAAVAYGATARRGPPFPAGARSRYEPSSTALTSASTVQPSWASRRANCSAAERESGGRRRVRDGLRPAGARDRDHHRATWRASRPGRPAAGSPRARRRPAAKRAWAGAEARAALPMPPSGLQGRNASPSSSHSSQLRLAAAERRGELVLYRDQPPTEDLAGPCRIWSGLALEIPAMRILPSSSSSRRAPIDSSYGTCGSGRWNW